LIEVDNNRDVVVLGRLYEGTKGLWELTRKKANSSLITTMDLKT